MTASCTTPTTKTTKMTMRKPNRQEQEKEQDHDHHHDNEKTKSFDGEYFIYRGGKVNNDMKSLIKHVRVAEDVTEIGDEAFLLCINLISVDLSLATKLQRIGKSSFKQCFKLKTVIFPSTKAQGGEEAEGNSTLSSSSQSQLKIIDDNAFYCCKSLELIELPSSVTTTGQRAFYNCNSEHFCIKFSKMCRIEVIEKETFAECHGLRAITLPSSVRVIENRAFEHCEVLSKIAVPDQVEKFGDSAFYCCYDLTTMHCYGSTNEEEKNDDDDGIDFDPFHDSDQDVVVLPTSLKYLGTEAFGESSMEYLKVSNGLQSIKKGAFSDCCNLRFVILPDSMEELGAFSFYGCESLEEIILPKSLKKIESRAFYGCRNLSNLTLPDSLESIDESCFEYCRNIFGVLIIPNSVRKVGRYAFRFCNNLEYVILSTSLRTIEDGVFSNCSLAGVDIPNSVRRICRDAFNNGIASDTVNLPSNLKCINKNAFGNCKNLRNISLPERIEIVDVDAFKNCPGIPMSVHYQSDLCRGGKRFLIRDNDAGDYEKGDENKEIGINDDENVKVYTSGLWPFVVHRVWNRIDIPIPTNKNNQRNGIFIDPNQGPTESKKLQYINSDPTRRASIVYWLMIHGTANDM